ncbi:MAG TPA: L-histidine N(alpha)-methyltransferase [Candidatus Saccharimonadales bacterium]|nr:L-histidine N(alpha)-methyltransferase [Candidatus Saccharimonadales bacterium]
MQGSVLSRRQEAEFITAIQGRGEVPLKFAYLGEGAQNWDRIARERSEGEGINSAEAALLQKRVDDFLSTLEPDSGINVIDIGCGNGLPVLPILDRLAASKIAFTYVPLDISKEMLDLATQTINSRYPQVECRPTEMDFELGQFSDLTYQIKEKMPVNLLLFLGSTLGNHSDLNRVLSNFRDSMTSKDFLILGVELTNLAKVDKLFPHYENEGVQTLVTYALNYLKIPQTTFSYKVSWNEKYSQIEMRAVFNQEVPVEFADEKFSLSKGENLLLGRSIKFTEYSVTKLLSDVGFRTELLTTPPDRGYLLTMIQPTRYSV